MIESFFKILRKLGLRESLLVALSQFHRISLSLRLISELSGATSSLCTSFFLDVGGGGGWALIRGWALITELFLPTGWALIRGWALNRINTVCDLKKKIADTLLRKFVNSTCAYPINSFEDEESYRNRSASFRFQKSYKHITPSLRIMSTQGSHCEPPANKIIEPLIASTNGASRESDSFSVTFSPVSFCVQIFEW